MSSDAAPAAIPNVLAERYASAAMKDIWSQHGRVALERDFWIAVMKAQRDLGVPIPAEAIKDYERVKDQIDLAAIAQARARDAPRRQGAHRGILRAGQAAVHPSGADEPRPDGKRRAAADPARRCKLVEFKAAAALLALARQAEAHRDLMITGRTHNVPAQPTTLGKRLAMFGQELLVGFTRLRGADRALSRCAA